MVLVLLFLTTSFWIGTQNFAFLAKVLLKLSIGKHCQHCRQKDQHQKNFTHVVVVFGLPSFSHKSACLPLPHYRHLAKVGTLQKIISSI